MHFRQIVFCLFIIFSSLANARAESTNGFAMPLSLSAGFGTLKDSALDLKSRNMSAASVELLPGLRLGNWIIGPHIDYRSQGQMSSLADAGGTNLKGTALLYGFALRNQISERAFFQQSYDFGGTYDLTRDTGNSQDDEFKEPFGVRLKAGYAIFKNSPRFTLDFDLQYLTFQKIHIAGDNSNSNARQFMAAVGLSYYFGSRVRESVPAPEPLPVKAEPPPPVVAPPVAAPPVVVPVPVAPATTPTTGLFQFDLKSGAFDFGSSYLGTEYKAKIRNAADYMKQNPDIALRIEGHTDSAEANRPKLSLQRAQVVKDQFVQNGIEPSRLHVFAAGSRLPASNDESAAGRSLNRRVEVTIESGESK